jgi:CDP-diacylglycerol--glycerol-3-phosphate 3-phosphatidyltransferase
MALNAIDGMLAREHGQASRLGAVLNELGDVVADAGLYLPLALTTVFSLWPLAVFRAARLADGDDRRDRRADWRLAPL